MLVGEDVVEAVVGKAKQGNKKFVYWSKPDGSSYAKDTCTWETKSINEEFDPELLVGHAAQFKKGQSLFHCIIERCESRSKYWVKFKSNRQTDRVVDLELPKTVASGEFSWWRLDGYETDDPRRKNESESEEDESDEEVDDEEDK